MFLPSHRSTRPTILVLWLLAVWLLQTVAGPGAAGATIYAPMTDAELADRSPLIAEVRVLAVEAAPGDRIATDYLVEVERLIKGALPAATLVVRVPGGVRPDGLGRHIWGAPKFREGDQALLFLEPRSDGTFALHQLLLGAFHLTGQDPGAPRIAWRDLSGARAITPAGDQAPIETSRDLVRFRRWLEDRERGRGRSPDYFLAADPASETVPAKFTTLLSSTDPPPAGCGGNGGHSLRWFDFDFSQDVGWRTHFSGQTGVESGGIEAFRTALAAWTDDPNTPIRYLYDGLTAAAGGVSVGDGTNTVLFDDPNDEIGGSFDGSGLLAVGGPRFDCQLLSYQGESFHPVLEGDIVTQDGLALFFASTPDPTSAAEQLFGHELGHTLGLAHSQDPEALMLAEVHSDQRGAALDTDDLAGVLYLYGERNLVPPAPPSDLTAALYAEGRVRLEWSDNSSNESVFRIERRSAAEFALVTTVANDVTSFIDFTVSPATLFTYRLRAQNGAGASGYSNEAAILTPEDQRPLAPSNLRAAALSSTELRLTWQDNGDDETGFIIEIRVDGEWVDIPASLEADTDKAIIGGLTPATLYTFRVRAFNGFGDSETSNQVGITTFAEDPACVVTGDHLCLLDGRFEVSVDTRNQHNDGAEGTAVAVPSTNESGLFWFFGPENIELIVKALDGRTFNDHFWLFYGALSDVEYRIQVRDTVTGAVRVYHNPPGEICGRADTVAFPDETVEIPSSSASLSSDFLTTLAASRGEIDVSALTVLSEASQAPVPSALEAGTCVPGPQTLCLLDDLLRVEVQWRNQHDGGTEGFGRAVVDTDNSGLFWFFNIENVEMVIKALDGGAFNGHIWIFYGALTDLEYWITVTHTVTGESRVYYNPPGEVCGRGDIQAFSIEPPEEPGDDPEDPGLPD